MDPFPEFWPEQEKTWRKVRDTPISKDKAGGIAYELNREGFPMTWVAGFYTTNGIVNVTVEATFDEGACIHEEIEIEQSRLVKRETVNYNVWTEKPETQREFNKTPFLDRLHEELKLLPTAFQDHLKPVYEGARMTAMQIADELGNDLAHALRRQSESPPKQQPL